MFENKIASLKDITKKIRRIFNRKKLKIAGLAACMTIAMSNFAFASGLGGSGTSGAIISQIGGIITDMFLYIGIFLLIVSIGQVVLAQRNEDAEGKIKAIQQALVSVALIVIKPLVNAVLSATGTGISI